MEMTMSLLTSSLTSTIRIASVPADHVYVRHLAPLDEAAVPDVIRLPDPDPDNIARSAMSRWWPPAMLESEWIASSQAFDIFHIQFGFDARTPGQLQELADALRRQGKPLVYTAHDLRNPHHAFREEHDAQLDVLIPAADAVITLTPGAAREIKERWGREAFVIPHPHVVDFLTMERLAAKPHDERTFRVGVHVKSLRASMNPAPVISALIDILASLPGAILQVDGHPDVLEEGAPRFDSELAALLQRASSAGDIDLRIHDFFTDAELWDYLSDLDVSVLPYRFGTHSGWLEACHDLGTTVIAPDCGYYSEQGPAVEYTNNETEFDPDSLEQAVQFAYDTRPRFPASVSGRRRQRQKIADAHYSLYRSLLL